MARTALRVKSDRLKKIKSQFAQRGEKMPFPTRVYNRCKLCYRIGSFIRRFQICRICFRELASRGQIPGVTKSSW